MGTVSFGSVVGENSTKILNKNNRRTSLYIQNLTASTVYIGFGQQAKPNSTCLRLLGNQQWILLFNVPKDEISLVCAAGTVSDVFIMETSE